MATTLGADDTGEPARRAPQIQLQIELHDAYDGRGDLRAAMRRRLDRVCVIVRLAADEPEVDHTELALERDTKDRVVEDRQRRRRQALEHRVREAAVVDRAERDRNVARDDARNRPPVP